MGDGLSCYDPKLCSRGFRWSPDQGCVDIDECSLPDPPCDPPQVCQNTPGSFRCLEASSSTRSGVSVQQVQFFCGNTSCPSGMDCISVNGTPRCADPCEHHTVLNDDWRSTNNTDGGERCDRTVSWQGWYRLVLGGSSAHIPERCIRPNSCGTNAPLWLADGHPTRPGLIVSRKVCNSWANSCCFFTVHFIQVKLCSTNFYVYKLVAPVGCSLAYCAGTGPPNVTL